MSLAGSNPALSAVPATPVLRGNRLAYRWQGDSFFPLDKSEQMCYPVSNFPSTLLNISSDHRPRCAVCGRPFVSRGPLPACSGFLLSSLIPHPFFPRPLVSLSHLTCPLSLVTCHLSRACPSLVSRLSRKTQYYREIDKRACVFFPDQLTVPTRASTRPPRSAVPPPPPAVHWAFSRRSLPTQPAVGAKHFSQFRKMLRPYYLEPS